MKTYRVEFYKGVGPHEAGGGRHARLADVFAELAAKGCPTAELRSHPVEIRDLVVLGHGRAYRGVIGKLRQDDLPTVSAPRKAERRLPINQDEGLLEKNHFLYVRENNILVWQANRHGCGIGVLGEYISEFTESAVDFADILQLEPLRRLLAGETRIRKASIRIAKPTNPEFVRADDWGPQLDLMADMGASTLCIELSGNGYVHDDRRYLNADIKGRLRNLFRRSRDIIKSARVEFEHEGDRELKPLDLIADALSVKVKVEMDGHYPVPESMYRALDRALREQRATLQEIFAMEAAGN